MVIILVQEAIGVIKIEKGNQCLQRCYLLVNNIGYINHRMMHFVMIYVRRKTIKHTHRCTVKSNKRIKISEVIRTNNINKFKKKLSNL